MYNLKYRESAKTIFWGLLLIIGAFMFWFYLVGNPIDELYLILNAKTASGFITNTWEDVEDGDDGRTHWNNEISYKFTLPNGTVYNNVFNGYDQLPEELKDISQPYPIEVEYLSNNPQVSRIKGTGHSTVFEWLWREIGFGGLLLIMFVSPGFVLVCQGIKEIYKQNNKWQN